jgi:hypothetical protein
MFELKLGGNSICPANCTGASEPFDKLPLMAGSHWAQYLKGGVEAELLATNFKREAIFHHSAAHPQMAMEVVRVCALRVNR